MAATRRESLETVERLWDKYFDMRTGQLVTNIAVFTPFGPVNKLINSSPSSCPISVVTLA